ncbi:hypothetical protein [Nocardia sp. XZ_19_369]|nr:hypothetical protein [Nocardia sp. XZ_19_369]
MAYVLAVALGMLLIIGIVALVAWDDVRDRSGDETQVPEEREW